MTITQKGFSNSIVIAIVAILVVVAAVAFYSNKKSSDTNTTATSTVDTPSASSTDTVSDTNSNTSSGPSISWTYVKKDATTNTVVLNLNGKTYNTGVSGVGCGTEVAKSNLAAGQLSATRCTIQSESGTEVALYREGKGYKVTSTEIHKISDGQNITLERGTATTILNIK